MRNLVSMWGIQCINGDGREGVLRGWVSRGKILTEARIAYSASQMLLRIFYATTTYNYLHKANPQFLSLPIIALIIYGVVDCHSVKYVKENCRDQ
jgi:hypothetical protein